MLQGWGLEGWGLGLPETFRADPLQKLLTSMAPFASQQKAGRSNFRILQFGPLQAKARKIWKI